jgi:hypothetical protein
MFTYKNVSPFNYVIPEVGEVAPGETIESPFELENPNLQLVQNELQAAPIAPAKPPVVATIAAPVAAVPAQLPAATNQGQ